MKNRTCLRVVLGSAFLMALALGGLHAQETGSGEKKVEKKVTKRIIITGDEAIVDGDTIDLDKLEESLGKIGQLDITIQGETGEKETDGVTEKRNEIVKFGGDVRVEADEKITGSVVVFGGTATIAGTVVEDVVVFGGDLVLEETADVRGSVVCFGGKIEKAPGAKIGEQEVSLGSFPGGITVGPIFGESGVGSLIGRGVGLFARIVLVGFLILLGVGIVFLFPNALNRVSEAAEGNLLKAGLVGLLGEILVLPVLIIATLILAVSIIGIPLLLIVIPLAILGIVAALFLGYIGVGVFAGRKIGQRAATPIASPYRVMIVGVIALLSFHILASIACLVGHALWPIETLFAVVGCLITYLAITFGFGAVILTRFGTRRFVEAPPAPPTAVA